MDSSSINQAIQYIAWFIAMAELIVGLYILVLNPKHTANRYVAIFLWVTALNSYAVGLMVTSENVWSASLPAIILALTTSATEPILLLTTVALLKPAWLEGRRHWYWLPVYLLVFLPAILTLIDLLFGTRLWYIPLDPSTYTGGFVVTPEFTIGSLSWVVRAGFILSFLIIAGILLKVALFEKETAKKDRRLAWILLAQQFLAGFTLTYLATVIVPAVAILLTNTIFVVLYAYAAFQQMISEHTRQRSRLQVRLIAVLLLVSLPTMIAMTAFITNQARLLLENSANLRLQSASQQLATTAAYWLDDNVRSLSRFVAQPSIVSMNPLLQKRALEAMLASSEEISLVTTVNLDGKSLARSDDFPLEDFSTAGWFQKVRDGAPLALETIPGRRGLPPRLIISVPIINSYGDTDGVAMFMVNLSSLNSKASEVDLGENGQVIVVDRNNVLLAHTEEVLGPDLGEISQEPAVSTVAGGLLGPFTFVKEDGDRWRAKASLLPNSWAAIVQVPESDLLGPLTVFERIAWLTLIAAAALLVVLAGLMIRQTIRPIQTLTEVTAALAAGDLTQVAPVESEDEIGALARTFNRMTDQIRDLVSGLERRVTERTADLERRAVQLHVAAQVSSEAAGIHDLPTLLDYTVQLISDRFGFYHAGIFLNDQPGEYTVLSSASSEGGHRMLVRGHKLKIGEVGIVGFAAGSGEPRIALDVGRDAVFFNNPDLPQTRSEMALPLKAHGRVIGVLDVQSKAPAAFTSEDVSTLQILADQIALAIENARLLEMSRSALRELESQYQRQIGVAWQEFLAGQSLGFRYDRMGIQPLSAHNLGGAEARFSDPRAGQKTRGHKSRSGNGGMSPTANHVSLPIRLRGIQIGQLNLDRDADAPNWTQSEIDMIETTLAQVSLALENARLHETVRRRVEKERMVNRISARTQTSLDVETVMKRAVEEIGQALKVDKVQIRLHRDHPPAPPPASSSGNGKSRGSQ